MYLKENVQEKPPMLERRSSAFWSSLKSPVCAMLEHSRRRRELQEKTTEVSSIPWYGKFVKTFGSFETF